MAIVRNGAEKWMRRASQSTPDYSAGIQSPRVVWHQAVAAAAPAWTDGIQQAITNGSYGKAATPQNSAKWLQKAASLGAQRYASGVQSAQQAYTNGFGPYAQVIGNTALPPRGRRGDPNNIQRVAVLAAALHAAKIAKQTGG